MQRIHYFRKKQNTMEAISVKDYRNNLSKSFARADKGEHVLIRRRNQLYALVSVGREDLILTPELQQRIEQAQEQCRQGECVVCKTKEEIENYLQSL